MRAKDSQTVVIDRSAAVDAQDTTQRLVVSLHTNIQMCRVVQIATGIATADLPCCLLTPTCEVAIPRRSSETCRRAPKRVYSSQLQHRVEVCSCYHRIARF
jgi:hypothetical protein